MMCPQPGPGTRSYLARDRIFVFLQVRNGFSDPHVNGPYHSVHVVGSVDPIGHPDQGIWWNKAGTALIISLGKPR